MTQLAENVRFFGNEFSDIIMEIQKKYQDIDKTTNFEEDIQIE